MDEQLTAPALRCWPLTTRRSRRRLARRRARRARRRPTLLKGRSPAPLSSATSLMWWTFWM